MSDTAESADPGTDTPDPALVEVRREKRREDRVRTTGRISESVRYVGFGLVAVTFSLLLSESNFAEALVKNHKSLLTTSAFWGCVAILLDYFSTWRVILLLSLQAHPVKVITAEVRERSS